jgi:hypothetical protein
MHARLYARIIEYGERRLFCVAMRGRIRRFARPLVIRSHYAKPPLRSLTKTPRPSTISQLPFDLSLSGLSLRRMGVL